jgi:hypothetical protein
MTIGPMQILKLSRGKNHFKSEISNHSSKLHASNMGYQPMIQKHGLVARATIKSSATIP